MKSIANYISVSRIFLAFTLALVKPFSILFLTIYLVCGVSDVLDGYIARKTNTKSDLGGKLDSVADLTMVLVLIIILYPIIINQTVEIIVYIIVIGIIRLVSMIVVLVKYKTFEVLHTYGNKITGIALFLYPILITFVKSDILIYIICIIASVSAIEELVIHLLSKKLQTNRKSIFS